jgi:thioesterase domain-containing protein
MSSEISSVPVVEPAQMQMLLCAQIPLAAEMEVVVKQCDGRRVVLEAPLAPNSNHLGTAFGGSLHALPILAGYSVVFSLLREYGFEGHVVVKRSSASYRQPVRETLRAVCVRPAAAAVQGFVASLREFGQGKLLVDAVVEGSGGMPAVKFAACFVAVLGASGASNASLVST